jgi:hypothetical protein
MSEQSINFSDPLWEDFYPEPSVFERTETSGIYRFEFVSRATGEKKDVTCRWEDLRYKDQVVMDSEFVQTILDTDRKVLNPGN